MIDVSVYLWFWNVFVWFNCYVLYFFNYFYVSLSLQQQRFIYKLFLALLSNAFKYNVSSLNCADICEEYLTPDDTYGPKNQSACNVRDLYKSLQKWHNSQKSEQNILD